MKNKKLASLALIATAAVGVVGAVALSGTKDIVKGAADGELNKLSLNADNKLSFEEAGSWDSPKPNGTTFTRKTNLGADITWTGFFGRSLNTTDNNFAIARGKNGWFTNVDPIHGITKVEVKCTPEATFRLDFSATAELNEYAGDAELPSYVGYSTEEYTGSSTYTINVPEGGYKYIRFQPASDANNWINYLNVYYTCLDAHYHAYEHHDEVAPHRENDGVIEHYTCSSCDLVFDADKNVVDPSDLVIASRMKTYTAPGDGKKAVATYDDFGQIPLTETINIDLRFDTPWIHSEIAINIGRGWDDYFGKYWVDCEKKQNCFFEGAYPGLSLSELDDGWFRVTINLSECVASKGTVTDYVDLIWFTAPNTVGNQGNGAVEILATGGNVVTPVERNGANVTAGSDSTISFKNKYVRDSAIVEAWFTFTTDDTTKFSVMVGNWQQYNGYYDINKTSNGTIYNGVVATKVGDDAVKVTFDLGTMDKVTGGGAYPTGEQTYQFLYVRGAWTSASGSVYVRVFNK